jgi:serine/threonine-protein kinase
MPPEALERLDLDRRADVYATGVMLWETLTGRRLFGGDADQSLFARILTERVPLVSETNASLERYDDVVARALHRDREKRYASAHQMILALEQCGPSATPTEVAQWVRSLASEALDRRSAVMSELETSDVSAAIAAPATTTPGPVPAPRREPRRTLAASGAVLLVAATVFGVVLGRRHAPRTPAPVGQVTQPEAPASTSASSGPEPAAEAPPPPSGEAVASPARSTRGVRSAGPARVTAVCDPPYILDSAGRRHYKMECVRAH